MHGHYSYAQISDFPTTAEQLNLIIEYVVWENSRRSYKPSLASRVDMTLSNSPSPNIPNPPLLPPSLHEFS